VAGVATGFALFYLFRPLLSEVPFTGAPFATGDLSLGWVDVVLVVVGVPVAAVVSARLALRRVQPSPLGASRRVSSARPGAVGVLPLLAGIAVLAYFDAAGKPGSNSGQLLELFAGFALLVTGLVLAGPWLTTAGSRLMAARARRPATLVADRRLLDNPKAAFRFVSGLVIALFVTSALFGALSSIGAASGLGGGSAGKETVADVFCSFGSDNCAPATRVPSVPAHVLEELRTTPGVRGVAVVHESPSQGQQGNAVGLVACDQLARTPAIGRCAPGVTAVSIGYFLTSILGASSHASTTEWPSAHRSVPQIARLPVAAVVVATDGTPGAIERARTSLEVAFPAQGEAVVVEALDPSTARLLAMVEDMTDVVIVASLVIAACSLAVNIGAGMGSASARSASCGSPASPPPCCTESSPSRVRCRRSWCRPFRSPSASSQRRSTSTRRSASSSGSPGLPTGRRSPVGWRRRWRSSPRPSRSSTGSPGPRWPATSERGARRGLERTTSPPFKGPSALTDRAVDLPSSGEGRRGSRAQWGDLGTADEVVRSSGTDGWR